MRTGVERSSPRSERMSNCAGSAETFRYVQGSGERTTGGCAVQFAGNPHGAKGGEGESERGIGCDCECSRVCD